MLRRALLVSAAAAGAAGAAAAAETLPPALSIACNFTVGAQRFDLSEFRGVVVSGVEDGGSIVRTSLCGDLARPCIDALTKTPINGSTMLFFEAAAAADHCWDTIAQWALFPPAAFALPPPKRGLRIFFSRPGDAHLDCDRVNVTVDAACNATMPPQPTASRLSGFQDGCDWTFTVETGASSVCSPGR